MTIDLDRFGIVKAAIPSLVDLHKRLLIGHVRILVVVDTQISLSPGAEAFGIERVIRLLRESSVGCMHFHVDAAERSPGAFSVIAAPAGTDAKYVGFRFDSQLPDNTLVINHYDEVWCFGFRPDNNGDTDANITLASSIPASDSELAALTTWMNKKGGMFATGDHDYLGASMCHRIPRVSTMRAWTNAQGVPPIGTPLRIDTNRPANAAQAAGTETIPFEAQGDAVPQQIEWVPWLSFRRPWSVVGAVWKRPHPVLCHPTLGPIDVMPDHPHEGVVFDHVAQPDVGLAAITLTNNYDFGGGVTGAEYPAVGATQPLPMVIAHGRTLADPPLMHIKGDSPAKRFAMISVYDGHQIDIGRVVTDSTWHHWMNINITQIEAAGGANWEKIRQYYLNVAVWLAPPRIPRVCWYYWLVASLYAYPGIVEFRQRANALDLGLVAREYFRKLYGPCWILQFVLDTTWRLDPRLHAGLLDRYLAVPLPKRPFPPRPDPCLTCPPPELFEAAVLGGMVKSMTKLLHADDGMEGSLKRVRSLTLDGLDKQLLAGASEGLKELKATYEVSLKQTAKLFG